MIIAYCDICFSWQIVDEWVLHHNKYCGYKSESCPPRVFFSELDFRLHVERKQLEADRAKEAFDEFKSKIDKRKEELRCE